MKGYIIKCTYTDGAHKGTEYFLSRGGYVIDPVNVCRDYTYASLSSCKAVCSRKAKDNNRDVLMERRDRERRLADGKSVSKYNIYDPETYEPYEVDVI